MGLVPLLFVFLLGSSTANEISRCCSAGARHFREQENCVNPSTVGFGNSVLCSRANSVCCLRALLDQSCERGRKLAQNNGICPALINRIGGGFEKECCDCCMMAKDLRAKDEPCVASRQLSAPCLQTFNACCNRTRSVFESPRRHVRDRCANSLCSHLCNDRGDKEVECSCRMGFTLAPNGFTCIAVEECNFLNERAYCSKHRDRCIVKRGMYRCDPKADENLRFMSAAPTAEFRPIQNATFSNDIGQLIQRKKPQRIRPQNVSQCAPGFRDSDGKGVCKDIDECAAGMHRCTPLQTCQNTDGNYKCVEKRCSWNEIQNPRTGECIPVECPEGYLPNSGSCVDINECNAPGRCGPRKVCINTQGSYRCVDEEDRCPSGFRVARPSGLCDDIDECIEGSHTCGANGQCINVQGSFTCKCPQGFQFNETTRQCDDINECETFAGHMCSPHANCENTVGSFKCHCKSGFLLADDGRTCNDVDECATGSHKCHQKCTNTPGSYECDCEPGYRLDSGDKRTCQDIDECQGHNVCLGGCTNTPGSFQCTCPRGYRLDTDGFRCKDINECGKNTCEDHEALCINTIGSFKCRHLDCPQDFVYDSYYKNNVEDGYSCLKKCSVSDENCMSNITREILYQFRSIASMPVVNKPVEVSRIHTQMHMPFSVDYEIENDSKQYFVVEQRDHIGILNLIRPIEGPLEITIKLNIRTKSRTNVLIAHNVAYIQIAVAPYTF
ncbi:hypothetical protein L596_004694 [Steinernema carpocapsae]|uniref:EGF-like domain-containing protein n=1 Tax=Steinernema carpocapsae TaxID=34508 RepID=A0A4U8V069_STECR|nr:hypothetical protein L596_004694 [Steinernema carpocapsae]